MLKLTYTAKYAAIAFAFLLLVSSCGGPVGGFQISVCLNGQPVEFTGARIYVDKVNLFERADGTIGYESLPPDSSGFSHLTFTLISGEKGEQPPFTMNWLAEASNVTEIAGRNFAGYSVKMYPVLEEFRGVSSVAQHVASYNGETCYILITITNVDAEKRWINGVFNGVYVERIRNNWRRMELREGRFGAEYTMLSREIASTESTESEELGE